IVISSVIKESHCGRGSGQVWISREDMEQTARENGISAADAVRAIVLHEKAEREYIVEIARRHAGENWYGWLKDRDRLAKAGDEKARETNREWLAAAHQSAVEAEEKFISVRRRAVRKTREKTRRLSFDEFNYLNDKSNYSEEQYETVEGEERLEHGFAYPGTNGWDAREVLVFDKRVDVTFSAFLAEGMQTLRHRERELGRPLKTMEKLDLLMEYVKSRIEGDISFASELQKSKKGEVVFIGEIIKQGKGVCRHRATLMKFLMQEAGIKCRLVRGDVYGPVKEAHGDDAREEGEKRGRHIWIEMDASIDGKEDGLIVDPMWEKISKRSEEAEALKKGKKMRKGEGVLAQQRRKASERAESVVARRREEKEKAAQAGVEKARQAVKKARAGVEKARAGEKEALSEVEKAVAAERAAVEALEAAEKELEDARGMESSAEQIEKAIDMLSGEETGLGEVGAWINASTAGTNIQSIDSDVSDTGRGVQLIEAQGKPVGFMNEQIDSRYGVGEKPVRIQITRSLDRNASGSVDINIFIPFFDGSGRHSDAKVRLRMSRAQFDAVKGLLSENPEILMEAIRRRLSNSVRTFKKGSAGAKKEDWAETVNERLLPELQSNNVYILADSGVVSRGDEIEAIGTDVVMGAYQERPRFGTITKEQIEEQIEKADSAGSLRDMEQVLDEMKEKEEDIREAAVREAGAGVEKAREEVERAKKRTASAKEAAAKAGAEKEEALDALASAEQGEGEAERQLAALREEEKEAKGQVLRGRKKTEKEKTEKKKAHSEKEKTIEQEKEIDARKVKREVPEQVQARAVMSMVRVLSNGFHENEQLKEELESLLQVLSVLGKDQYDEAKSIIGKIKAIQAKMRNNSRLAKRVFAEKRQLLPEERFDEFREVINGLDEDLRQAMGPNDIIKSKWGIQIGKEKAEAKKRQIARAVKEGANDIVSQDEELISEMQKAGVDFGRGASLFEDLVEKSFLELQEKEFTKEELAAAARDEFLALLRERQQKVREFAGRYRDKLAGVGIKDESAILKLAASIFYGIELMDARLEEVSLDLDQTLAMAEHILDGQIKAAAEAGITDAQPEVMRKACMRALKEKMELAVEGKEARQELLDAEKEFNEAAKAAEGITHATQEEFIESMNRLFRAMVRLQKAGNMFAAVRGMRLNAAGEEDRTYVRDMFSGKALTRAHRSARRAAARRQEIVRAKVEAAVSSAEKASERIDARLRAMEASLQDPSVTIEDIERMEAGIEEDIRAMEQLIALSEALEGRLLGKLGARLRAAREKVASRIKGVSREVARVAIPVKERKMVEKIKADLKESLEGLKAANAELEEAMAELAGARGAKEIAAAYEKVAAARAKAEAAKDAYAGKRSEVVTRVY
ncbi:MAG: hypothetical protein GF392_02230, partial [Candidatus Omnitrophica bacterium]|nr:hypothetical protein [Candidatus Omnitrophota bacterium]